MLFCTVFNFAVNAQTKPNNPSIEKTTAKTYKKQKELVYLYRANGGMIGYFSDGTVVGCPKCDFCRSNILAMFKEKPMRKWDLKTPTDFVPYEKDNGWVLINYKWQEKVPQF